jgi:hypothetical protein|tara:strand:- start:328 stop:486 length:159 start_codon:yes stop_codon:yes gene_type:complete
MENGDDKEQSVEKNDEKKVSAQKSWLSKEEKKDSYTSVTGRPNINIINKRNK